MTIPAIQIKVCILNGRSYPSMIIELHHPLTENTFRRNPSVLINQNHSSSPHFNFRYSANCLCLMQLRTKASNCSNSIAADMTWDVFNPWSRHRFKTASASLLMVMEYWFAMNSPNSNNVISVSQIKSPRRNNIVLVVIGGGGWTVN